MLLRYIKSQTVMLQGLSLNSAKWFCGFHITRSGKTVLQFCALQSGSAGRSCAEVVVRKSHNYHNFYLMLYRCCATIAKLLPARQICRIPMVISQKGCVEMMPSYLCLSKVVRMSQKSGETFYCFGDFRDFLVSSYTCHMNLSIDFTCELL